MGARKRVGLDFNAYLLNNNNNFGYGSSYYQPQVKNNQSQVMNNNANNINNSEMNLNNSYLQNFQNMQGFQNLLPFLNNNNNLNTLQSNNVQY